MPILSQPSLLMPTMNPQIFNSPSSEFIARIVSRFFKILFFIAIIIVVIIIIIIITRSYDERTMAERVHTYVGGGDDDDDYDDGYDAMLQ